MHEIRLKLIFLRGILRPPLSLWRYIPIRTIWREFAVWAKYYLAAPDFGSECTPWMTFSAVDFLRGKINRDFRVFEYGSGQSTVFFSRHAKEIVSVEHDPQWAESVARHLASEGAKNTTILSRPPSQKGSGQGSPANPRDYVSGDEFFSGQSFFEYASAVDSYQDGFFDLVVIDGRARPSCALHAMRKVTPGGWLLLDNADRPHYRGIHGQMADWEKHSFVGFGKFNSYVWQTCLWRRPVTG